MKIHLENVRCFDKPLDVTLRPLTLLVGENSTGKSTFLAMLAYLSQAEFPGLRPNFNTPPFDLGTYDSIATYKGGRYGRSGHFTVGFEDLPSQRKSRAAFVKHRGQPQLQSFSASSTSGDLTLQLGTDLRGRLVANYVDGERYETELDLTTTSEVGFLVSLFGAVTSPGSYMAES